MRECPRGRKTWGLKSRPVPSAHDDNLALGGEKGWVAQFRESLEIWLKRRGLKWLSVWWDEEKLRGNTDFDARIEDCLAKTALLVVLHSRNYRQSEYCHKELDWFISHAQRHSLGLSIGDNRRILNVLINNIHYREWTESDHWTKPLAGTAGIPLHDADKVDDFGDPASPMQFEAKLKPVVTAIVETLEAFPKKPEPAQETAEDRRPTVFLADVADTLRPFRKRLVKEIGARARVLDAVPPPLERNPHDQAVAQALEQADLSIHLLDQWPGRELEDDESATYPRRQADLVAESDTHALLWVPDTLTADDMEDEEQKAWLKGLEQATRKGGNYQFVRDGREPFIAQVLEDLERIAEQRQAQDKGPQRLLIDTHRKDQRYAYALAAGLTERIPDLDVDFTKDADGAAGWTQFEDAVREVHDLVVLFGGVAPAWVQGRVEHAWKVAATQFGSGKPALENIWVVLLPHCPGMPQLSRLIRVEVLDNSASDDIEPENLQRLLPGGAQGGVA